MRILISRTDSIGDVVLTLPVAGILKQTFPGCTIIFLGREYTRAVIEACDHVDQFVAWPPMPPPQPSPRGRNTPTPALPRHGGGRMQYNSFVN